MYLFEINLLAPTKPEKIRKGSHQAKALAAATRRCYLGLLIGASLGAGLSAICVFEALKHSHEDAADHESSSAAPGEGLTQAVSHHEVTNAEAITTAH